MVLSIFFGWWATWSWCSFDGWFILYGKAATNCLVHPYVPPCLVISNFKLGSACIVIKKHFLRIEYKFFAIYSINSVSTLSCSCIAFLYHIWPCLRKRKFVFYSFRVSIMRWIDWIRRAVEGGEVWVWIRMEIGGNITSTRGLAEGLLRMICLCLTVLSSVELSGCIAGAVLRNCILHRGRYNWDALPSAACAWYSYCKGPCSA
jgi:hypothetical protein